MRSSLLSAILGAFLLLATVGCSTEPTFDLLEGTYSVIQTPVDNGCALAPFPVDGMGTVELRTSRNGIGIDWTPSGFPGVGWGFRVQDDLTFSLSDSTPGTEIWKGCTGDVSYGYSGALPSNSEVAVTETVSFSNLVGNCTTPCSSSFDYFFTLAE